MAQRTSSSSSRSGDDPQPALQALRDRLARGVVVTAETIQETLDDAVRRGRMTRDDAQDLGNDMVSRGRRQAEDLLRELEALVERGRAQAAQSGDRVMREVDRARRAAGIGTFPILGYDDLDARQVTARLRDLAPADLRKVRTYEKRHRARKTVLKAIEKQLG
jgi:polyhydroxyalkanoate synthesis regulator phasin